MSEQQNVEIFHLLFLRQLGEKLHKDHYALKGGCNLRFYMKSIRYSEDMDLDVRVVAKDTLKSSVRKILESQAFIKTLASKGISIVESSAPKQTETTQRWKITLQTKGAKLPIHTKIEFSRRSQEFGPGAVFESVDTALVYGYGLYPIHSNHYNSDAAFLQKVNALIHRTETQARDIFDLDLLLIAGAGQTATDGIGEAALKTAQNNALSVSYADFTSQVLAYLLPEYRTEYPEEKWNQVVEKIIDVLEGMKP